MSFCISSGSWRSSQADAVFPHEKVGGKLDGVLVECLVGSCHGEDADEVVAYDGFGCSGRIELVDQLQGGSRAQGTFVHVPQRILPFCGSEEGDDMVSWIKSAEVGLLYLLACEWCFFVLLESEDEWLS